MNRVRGDARGHWLLLFVGVAGLMSGIALGHGLLIAGGLMVTSATVIDLSGRGRR